MLSTWRGKEIQQLIRLDMTSPFADLHDMARPGNVIEQQMGLSETHEHLKVVVLYISDFSHAKEILSRVQVTADQGCTLCNRPAGHSHKPQVKSRGQSELGKLCNFK